MRLDLFLPSPKSREANGGIRPRGWPRRLLAELGPSWVASPIRRVIQSASLVLFLLLFFYVGWPPELRPNPGLAGWPSHHANGLTARELLPAETFLLLDPLVSVSTALAARSWVWSLKWAGLLLIVCLLIPRGFCGFVCPLGTLIDLLDWAIGKRAKRLKIEQDGWWVNLKYYVLAATLIASLCGVLVSGFLAAIPVLTRGFGYLATPLGIGLTKGWYLVPPMHAGHALSILLFLIVLGLGFLRPRFWCRYVCPTGAVFSVANALRITDRKVESTCIGCGRCRKVCPFDAIRDDFTTRAADCTFCQTCGGVCPVRALKFVGRWDAEGLKEEDQTTAREIPLSRRGFLAGAVGGGAAAAGIRKVCGAKLCPHPVRPPGSVPEGRFLQLCIRCGECINACPSRVLQPMGFQQGLEGLWTPRAAADWSGCEPSCNLCGNVCPTGAIRALLLEEKRAARMGLAVINKETCLPHAGKGECQFCADQCSSAGYQALEFERVGVEFSDEGYPVEDSGLLAPLVRPDRCVGCGLCQTRCHGINVREKGLLGRSAIEVFAGQGKEDRMMTGSYRALRERERRAEEERLKKLQDQTGGDSYLPDFLE